MPLKSNHPSTYDPYSTIDPRFTFSHSPVRLPSGVDLGTTTSSRRSGTYVDKAGYGDKGGYGGYDGYAVYERHLDSGSGWRTQAQTQTQTQTQGQVLLPNSNSNAYTGQGGTWDLNPMRSVVPFSPTNGSTHSGTGIHTAGIHTGSAINTNNGINSGINSNGSPHDPIGEGRLPDIPVPWSRARSSQLGNGNGMGMGVACYQGSQDAQRPERPERAQGSQRSRPPGRAEEMEMGKGWDSSFTPFVPPSQTQSQSQSQPQPHSPPHPPSHLHPPSHAHPHPHPNPPSRINSISSSSSSSSSPQSCPSLPSLTGVTGLTGAGLTGSHGPTGVSGSGPDWGGRTDGSGSGSILEQAGVSRVQGQGQGQGRASSQGNPNGPGQGGGGSGLAATTSASASASGTVQGTGAGTGTGTGKDTAKEPRDKEGEEREGKSKGKKKAAKACLQCQKAHLTCDDSRPCTRCVKKGQGDVCCEGQRKKAKYLMTADELAEHNSKRRARARGNVSSSSSSLPTLGSLAAAGTGVSGMTPPALNSASSQTGFGSGQAQQAQSTQPHGTPLASVRNLSLIGEGEEMGDAQQAGMGMNQGFQFDSQAANLEYAALDSFFSDLTGLSDPDPYFPSNWQQPSSAGGVMFGTTEPGMDSMMDFGMNGVLPDPSQSQSQQGMLMRTSQPVTSIMGTDMIDQSTGLTPGSQVSGMTRSVLNNSLNGSSVYDMVAEPYDYTQGYHYLMRYLSKHFDQQSILHVVKSLAAFRPSLIALQMPLSFEDEVFLEKSFQRTLLELEKLISYSGTPTAVWRRTGEICAVGDEFCSLTGFSRSELLGLTGGKRKFIYELFDRPSTVDYFAKFSQHAFENTAQNFYMQVGLGGIQATDMAVGSQIRCAASFTIRRDVFDLPCAVIGQLLPVYASNM